MMAMDYGPSDMLAQVYAAYNGSNGGATKALYARLEELGPLGRIAVNLFRAQKNSARAKGYRRGYRGMAYDRKQWSIDNLSEILTEHAEHCSLPWGWGTDPQQPFHNVVLYVDLPTGQVSFHTDRRGDGPDYPGKWDGVPGKSADRIVRWVARVLAAEAVAS